MVRAGTTLTFRVEGQTGGFSIRDAPQVRAQTANALTPFVYLISLTLTSGSAGAILTDPSQWLNWRYSAVIVIKTRTDHRSIDDVRSIIAGAFYAGAGAMPSVALESESAGPGYTETPWENPLSGLFDSLTTTTVIIVAGLAGIVYLIAYGPNVGSIARAVPRV